MAPTPSNEQFDAMNDRQFAEFWDARMEAVQAQATSEDEVEACAREMFEAEMHRNMQPSRNF